MKRVFLLCAAGLTACAYQPNPQSDTFKILQLQNDTKLLAEKQAPFDLGCTTEEMVFKDLGGKTIGVKGCGKQGTYKHVQGVGWVLNASGATQETSE